MTLEYMKLEDQLADGFFEALGDIKLPEKCHEIGVRSVKVSYQ